MSDRIVLSQRFEFTRPTLRIDIAVRQAEKLRTQLLLRVTGYRFWAKLQTQNYLLRVIDKGSGLRASAQRHEPATPNHYPQQVVLSLLFLSTHNSIGSLPGTISRETARFEMV